MLITSFHCSIISSSPLAIQLVSFAKMEIITQTKCSATVHALVVLVTVILVAEGYFSEAAAGPCSTSMSSLSACLPAVIGDNPPSPTDACCAAVRITDTGCLCNVATEYSSVMGVNVTAALLMPKECKLVIPAGYICNGFLIHSYIPPHRKLMNL